MIEPSSHASTASLLEAARLAAGTQHYPLGSLYMVGSPIGNLADLSLRAIQVLALADAVACEDTRMAARLLEHVGLRKPLLAVHAHNEHEGAQALVQRLGQGQRVAYVSDAGTPGISDPGAVLVAAAVRSGYRVVPIPGASAATALLSVAGDAVTAGHAFVGFLPAKGAARQEALAQALGLPMAVVLFEAPHRIEALCEALASAAPERSVTLGRELTKQFETVATMPAAGLPQWLAEDPNRRRGEFALVVHAPPAAPAHEQLPQPAQDTLRTLLQELPMKQAVALTARLSGAPRNALYELALQWRGEAADGGDSDNPPHVPV